MPDGTVYRIDDWVKLAEPFSDNTMKERATIEKAYSYIYYDGLGANSNSFLTRNDAFTNYVKAYDIGKEGLLKQFKIKKTPRGTFEVFAIIVNQQKIFNGKYKRITVALEVMKEKELILAQ